MNGCKDVTLDFKMINREGGIRIRFHTPSDQHESLNEGKRTAFDGYNAYNIVRLQHVYFKDIVQLSRSKPFPYKVVTSGHRTSVNVEI